jgi:hypothetical protein
MFLLVANRAREESGARLPPPRANTVPSEAPFAFFRPAGPGHSGEEPDGRPAIVPREELELGVDNFHEEQGLAADHAGGGQDQNARRIRSLAA